MNGQGKLNGGMQVCVRHDSLYQQSGGPICIQELFLLMIFLLFSQACSLYRIDYVLNGGAQEIVVNGHSSMLMCSLLQ